MSWIKKCCAETDTVISGWIFFNFNRKTMTTGWEFNAVWLVKNDLVVYKLISGKPQVREDETRRNPLGPLQGIDTLKLPR